MTWAFYGLGAGQAEIAKAMIRKGAPVLTGAPYLTRVPFTSREDGKPGRPDQINHRRR